MPHPSGHWKAAGVWSRSFYGSPMRSSSALRNTSALSTQTSAAWKLGSGGAIFLVGGGWTRFYGAFQNLFCLTFRIKNRLIIFLEWFNRLQLQARVRSFCLDPVFLNQSTRIVSNFKITPNLKSAWSTWLRPSKSQPLVTKADFKHESDCGHLRRWTSCLIDF